jgi:hypothetical protein
MLLNEEDSMTLIEQVITLMTTKRLQGVFSMIIADPENEGKYSVWEAVEPGHYILVSDNYTLEGAIADFFSAEFAKAFSGVRDEHEGVAQLFASYKEDKLTPEQELGIKIALGDPQCTDLAIDILQRGG